jgi:hypothetical protein
MFRRACRTTTICNAIPVSTRIPIKNKFQCMHKTCVKDAEGLVRNAVEHGSAANPVAA